MPFAEVVPALQRGVVDCAVTGTLSGNTAGWLDCCMMLALKTSSALSGTLTCP
jgi:hypothetical protein